MIAGDGGCPGHDLGGTLDSRYTVRHSPTEPVGLDRGRSRRIHFVPLRRGNSLTGEYQQDHRRSSFGPVVSVFLRVDPVVGEEPLGP